MATINPALLQFFTQNFKPGAIGLVGAKDAIGLAIRDAQSVLTPEHKPSCWSHCFILGDLRWDLRGPNRTKIRSPYLLESDLKVALFKPQIRNGAQENWLGKWCVNTVEHAAVIDFSLSEEQRNAVLAAALQLVDEQVLYPIGELLGTWWCIITKRQWQENPLKDPHAMYCSSFVRYCYHAAQRDFLGQDISISNTAPEDLARAGSKIGQIVIYKN